jgi:N-acetylglucosamine-6-phosphate deacetylase
LKEGYDADLCVMDWSGNVLSTWVAGVEVWRDEQVGQGDFMGLRSTGKAVNGH